MSGLKPPPDLARRETKRALKKLLIAQVLFNGLTVLVVLHLIGRAL
jgi:hypothetical protein